MEQVPPHINWLASRGSRIIALALLLLSPVGAPAIGYSIIAVCSDDWEVALTWGLPKPILDYFPLTFLPFIWVGAFLGILWLLAAAAILLALVWFVIEWLWPAVMNRV